MYSFIKIYFFYLKNGYNNFCFIGFFLLVLVCFLWVLWSFESRVIFIDDFCNVYLDFNFSFFLLVFKYYYVVFLGVIFFWDRIYKS